MNRNILHLEHVIRSQVYPATIFAGDANEAVNQFRLRPVHQAFMRFTGFGGYYDAVGIGHAGFIKNLPKEVSYQGGIRTQALAVSATCTIAR